MIYLVGILGLIAGSLALAPGAVTITLCCAIGTGAGAWIIYGFVNHTLELRLTWIMAATLLMGYCGYTIFNEVAAVLDGQGVLAYIGVETDWAAYALLLVMLACIVLLLAGWAEPPMIGEQHIVALSGKQERFLWFGLALTALSYFRGDNTFGGTVSEVGSGKVDAFGSLVATITPVLFPLAVIGIIQSSGSRRLRFVVIGLLSTLMMATYGRRMMISMILITFIAASVLAGRKWRPKWHLSGAWKAMLGLIAVPVLAASSYFFYGLRMATWEMGEGTHTIGSIVETAEVTTFRSPSEIVHKLSENQSDRTAFAIRYLSWLARGGNTPSPMMGADVVQGAKMTVPDAVYHLFGASKDPIRHIGEEEDVANEHFGLPDEDMANSILTSGVIDFGLAGVLGYPLLLCFLARLVLSLASKVLNSEGQIVLILAMIIQFSQSENSVGGYLMDLRDIATLGLVWWVLHSIPSMNSRRQRATTYHEEFAAD
ncbi:MAG: hypothetical protein WBP95_08940 [Acidobacteriaceae bacterium]